MAAWISGRVRAVMKFSKCCGTGRARITGLPGHYRIEPREDGVEQQRLAGARRGLGRGTCSWYLRGGGRAGSFRPVNGLVIDAIRNSVPSSAGRPAVTSASPIAADQASSSRWTTPPTAPGIRPLVTSGPAALWAVMYKAERQL